MSPDHQISYPDLHPTFQPKIAMVALRLTFGDSPAPFKWGALSVTACDLETAILQDDKWDPMSLHAPNPELMPHKKIVDNSIPFVEG